jgi:hypothetical protein
MPVVRVLTIPPPGADTSTLARRLTTILPAMTLAEAIETTRIHSVAGLTGARTAVVTTRPFRTLRTSQRWPSASRPQLRRARRCTAGAAPLPVAFRRELSL